MNPYNILIIDDNPINLKLVKVLLMAEGYTIRTAEDANEAFETLKNFEPHLILMDIQLPGIDGLELTRLLKKDPRFKKIAIIAITAYAMKGDEEKALQAGCSGYITKPIDIQKLPKVVAEYLKKDINKSPA